MKLQTVWTYKLPNLQTPRFGWGNFSRNALAVPAENDCACYLGIRALYQEAVHYKTMNVADLNVWEKRENFRQTDLGLVACENSNPEDLFGVAEHAAPQQDLVWSQWMHHPIHDEVPCEGVQAAVRQLALNRHLSFCHVCLQMHDSSKRIVQSDIVELAKAQCVSTRTGVVSSSFCRYICCPFHSPIHSWATM